MITGYTARLDRARNGRLITAFINVRYPSSSHVGTEPWILELEKHPDVLECHHVAGDDCYILKVARSRSAGGPPWVSCAGGPSGPF